jgi:hypothetical protein
MVWYMIYIIYDTMYGMIWYMVWYDIYYIYDVWYDMIYGMIWYILYMIWCMVWYDIYYIWYDVWYDMIYDMMWYIYYCSWVATWWQQFSTHLHTNNTQNDAKQTIHRTTQKFRKNVGRAPSLWVLPWHLPYNWAKSTEKPQSG